MLRRRALLWALALAVGAWSAAPADADLAIRESFGSAGTAPGQFKLPYGVALDGAGNVLVADSDNGRVQLMSATGDPLAAWGSDGPGPGHFVRPRDVAVSPISGDIYVADTDSNEVEQYDAQRQLIRVWGGFGSKPGRFSLPTAIAIDRAASVYVADRLNDRVQKFSASGRLLRVIKMAGGAVLHEPTGVAVDAAGNLYVVAEGDTWVHKFSPSGRFLTEWGPAGVRNRLGGAGGLRDPFGIAVDPWQRVWVADLDDARLQVFAPDGNYAGSWPGTDRPRVFQGPYGLAIDCHGSLYVSDKFRAQITVLDQSPAATSCRQAASAAPALPANPAAPPLLRILAVRATQKEVRVRAACAARCRLLAFARFDPKGRTTPTVMRRLPVGGAATFRLRVPAAVARRPRLPSGKAVVWAIGATGNAAVIGRPLSEPHDEAGEATG